MQASLHRRQATQRPQGGMSRPHAATASRDPTRPSVDRRGPSAGARRLRRPRELDLIRDRHPTVSRRRDARLEPARQGDRAGMDGDTAATRGQEEALRIHVVVGRDQPDVPEPGRACLAAATSRCPAVARRPGAPPPRRCRRRHAGRAGRRAGRHDHTPPRCRRPRLTIVGPHVDARRASSAARSAAVGGPTRIVLIGPAASTACARAPASPACRRRSARAAGAPPRDAGPRGAPPGRPAPASPSS